MDPYDFEYGESLESLCVQYLAAEDTGPQKAKSYLKK